MAQCNSCQFHNMPGATHCGRCGSSLTLAQAVINVHPPRASKWAKTWRKTFLARQWNSVKGNWSVLADRIHLEPHANLPGMDILFRLILPGWPQQVSGNPFFGKCLFGAYLACILLALPLIGTVYSSLLIAAALTLHASSVYDIAHRSTEIRGGRLSRFFLGLGLLGICLYLPLFSWGTPYVSPFVIVRDRAPLQAGEVLVVNRQAYRSHVPQIGDLVVYEIPETRVNRPGVALLFRGERMDRVMAGSNQRVVWSEGHLTVDGQPSPWRPLAPENIPSSLEMVVPSGCYLIFPSTEGGRGPVRGQQVDIPWTQLCMVPRHEIRGRVYWRSWPWYRMGRVR